MAAPRVAVVGTGFGARVHVPALRAAGFDVVALVGTVLDRTARRAARVGVPRAIVDLDAVLGDVDAVTIATPPATHRALVLAALAAGRHVLCEKPFALSTSDALEMATAADRAGVTAVVGHEFRFAADRAVVGRAIESGAIGVPRIATLVQYVALVADPQVRMPAWWFDPTRGGGWLGASGSHLVDQVRVWLGEFASVSATLASVSPRAGAEDSFTIRAGLQNDCDVVLQQSAAAWGPTGGLTRVVGERGSVGIEDGRAWIADADGTRELAIPVDLVLPEPPNASDDPTHAYTHLELGPAIRLAEGFRAGIEGRPPESPVAVPTFADGVENTRVLDAVRASAAADGARVSV